MKTILAILIGAAAVVTAVSGEVYENFYLRYNSNANKVGEVTVDTVVYSLYGMDDIRWAVVTGGGRELVRIEIPAAVTFEDVDYPVKAIAGGPFKPELWYKNNETLEECILTNGIVEVASSVFSSFEALERVEFGPSLRSLGESVFSNTKALRSVVLPEGLSKIGVATFRSSRVETVKWPSTAAAIPASTFRDCDELTGVDVSAASATLKDIGNEAFCRCTRLQSFAMPGTVTNIGWSAFNMCTALESAVIPNGVATISRSMFLGCRSLASVTIPEGVKKIDSNAFGECGLLDGVTLPESLEEIGYDAFRACTNLTAITIPAAVTSLGYGVFSDCTSLEGVTVAGGNTSFRTFGRLLCTADGTELIHCPCSETEVVVPDGVGTIRKKAFKGCSGLRRICIPDSVTLIDREGGCAFADSEAVVEVELPGDRWRINELLPYWAYTYTLSNITVNAGTERLRDDFASRCRALSDVVLPESLRDIGESAFRECANLVRIELQEAVTNLGAYAFSGCSRLEEVNIPDGVKEIPEQCFSYCSRLEKVTLPGGIRSIGRYAFFSCGSLTDIVIPDGVRELRERTFDSCGKLCSADLPESITNIERSVFSGCQMLSSVRIPGQVRGIGERAFFRCRSLSSITIPEGVTRINDYTFSGCTGLISAGVPDGITSIGAYAFEGCQLLQKIRIPEGVEAVGNRAYYGCKSVKTAELPSTLVSFGVDTLRYCEKLEWITVAAGNTSYRAINGVLYSIDRTRLIHVPNLCRKLFIPAELTSFDTAMFANCPLLERVDVDPDNPTYSSYDGILYDKARTRIIFCARGIEHVDIDNTCEDLPKAAFQYCRSLRSVSVPCQIAPLNTYFDPCYRDFTAVELKTGTEVPYRFCRDCGNLEEVTLPETVTNIGEQAFYGCAALKAFKAPEGLTGIGDGAFCRCSALADVSLGDVLERIGNSAFANCDRLEFIELPSTVTWTGTDAFSAAVETTVFMDGPPPENIGRAGLASGDIVMRPKGYSNEWANAGIASGVRIVDMPEEGVSWWPDNRVNWAMSPNVHAHKGWITEDEIWQPDRTHVIYGWVTVSNGVKVTIRPGTVVKFCDGQGLLVRNGGEVIAEGVTFTHVCDDDVGGDSDEDYGTCPTVMNAYSMYGHIVTDEETAYRCRLYRYLSGTIGDEVWEAGNTYWVDENAVLPKGRTLTVEAGAVVKFGFMKYLTVKGRMLINGTRTKPVVITAYSDDDYGGDTDGEILSPEEQCWRGIALNDADAVLEADYAYFRYGGGRGAPGAANFGDHIYAPVRVNEGEAVLRGCTFADSYWGGVELMGGRLTAQNCLFNANRGCAVYADGGEAVIVNSVIYDCEGQVGNQTSGSGGRVQFRNTIISCVGDWAGEASGVFGYDHCCFWLRGGDDQTCSWDGHDGNMLMDPLFADPAAGDFRIGDASPCVDAGSAAAPVRDYWGQSRQNVRQNPAGERNGNGRYPDIGMYESMPLAGALDAPDIEVFDVSVSPKTFTVGDPVTVTYKFRNVSDANTASGTCKSRIDVVAENGVAYFGAYAKLLMSIAPGGKDIRTATTSFVVPAIPVGKVKIRVTGNVDRDIFEGLLYQNNTAESAEGTLMVSEIGLGDFVANGNRMLLPGGTYGCHIADGSVPANALVVIRTNPGADFSVITAEDRMPTDTYRYSVSEKMDDGVYFVELPEGSPYVTVKNNGGESGHFSAELAGSGLVLYHSGDLVDVVSTNFPNYGNQSECEASAQKILKRFNETGKVIGLSGMINKPVELPVRVWGNGFGDDLTICMKKGATVLDSSDTRVFSGHSAYARFDFLHAESGVYEMELQRGGQTTSVAWVRVYTPDEYLAAGKTALLYNLYGLDGVYAWDPFEVKVLGMPDYIRSGRIYKLEATWRNKSDREVDAPWLKLKSTLSAVRFDNSSSWHREFGFFGTSATRPVTRVKPGEGGAISFEFMATSDADKNHQPKIPTAGIRFPFCGGGGATTRRGGGGGGTLTISSGRRGSSGGGGSKGRDPRNIGNHRVFMTHIGRHTPGDASYLAANRMRPKDVNDELWGCIETWMRSHYSGYCDEREDRFRARLEDIAAELPADEPVPVLSDREVLLRDMARFISADPVIRDLDVCCDYMYDRRAVPLAFFRSYSTALDSRLSEGMLGCGWHTPLETRLNFESSEIAYVGVPGCAKECFERSEGTTGWDNVNYPGRNWLDGNRQVYRDGSYLEFRNADGCLTGAYDAHGRGIAITYVDGTNHIDRITHTDGGYLEFTYSGDGDNVILIKDHINRYLHFEYGTLGGGRRVLTRVVDMRGCEYRYTYHAADATPASRSLTRIEESGVPPVAFEWDSDGRIVSVTRGDRFTTEYVREGETLCHVIGPDGAKTTYEIGVRNNILSLTEPDGAKTKVQYDFDGRFPISLERASGKRCLIGYNGPGDVVKQVQPGGGVIEYAYDKSGKLAQMVDPDGKVRKYSYDANGDLFSENSPDGVSRYYSYNDDGDLRSCMFEGGERGVDIRYNANHDISVIAASNTDRKVYITRDACGRVTCGEDTLTGQFSIEYDSTNRITRFTSGGHTINMTYSGFTGLESIVDETGRGEHYEYDALGRLKTVSAAHDHSIVYLTNVYDDGNGGAGRLKREIFGNGVQTDYTYDPNGRVASITTSANGGFYSDYRYTYDADGKIASITDAIGGKTHVFAYDLDGQLALAQYSDGSEQKFGYDAAGNMRGLVYSTSFDQTTGDLLRIADSVNGTTTCGYDEFGRLNGVTNATRGINWSCTYNAFGGRATVTDGATTTVRVSMPFSNRLISEYVGGSCVRHHIWANGRRIAVERNGGVRYLHSDHLCSVRMVTDENGEITGTAEYRAYGECAARSGLDHDLCGWIAALGVETDPTGFHYMYHRYYSMQLGRFISEDPFGVAAGDYNLSRYCFNDPIGFFDPLGLNSIDCRGLSAMKDLCDLSGLLLTGFALVSGPIGMVVCGVAAAACAIASAVIEHKMNDGISPSTAGGLAATAASNVPGNAGRFLGPIGTAAGVGLTLHSWHEEASEKSRAREERRRQREGR